MSRKSRRNRRASKETGSNASAGKGDKGTPPKDSAKESDSSQQKKEDLSEAVKILQESWMAAPEKLDKLGKAEEQHTQVLNRIDNRIGEIEIILSPGRDIITKGLAKKLTPVERNKLMLERDKLYLLKRKVDISYQPIMDRFISVTKNERQGIRRDELREKVKDPNYYKRYGKNIVPAFQRMLNEPMTNAVLNGLRQLLAKKGDSDFDSLLGKFLLWNNQELYIKSTGNAELKPKYFEEFRKILENWDPEIVVIKSQTKK
jgi:hypothetical protein